jgi:hypothetical protein
VKKIIASLLALALINIPINANAVENGVSAEGDPRIVSLYKGSGYSGFISIDFPMCSGYLLSERIVVTAQHCTFDPQRNAFRDASELIIGRPGEKSNRTPGRHFAVAVVFRAPDYKGYDIKTDLSYTNDVAVLVLAKPVPNTTRAKLLNETEFNNLISEKPEIWILQNSKLVFLLRRANGTGRIFKKHLWASKCKTLQEQFAMVIQGLVFGSRKIPRIFIWAL